MTRLYLIISLALIVGSFFLGHSCSDSGFTGSDTTVVIDTQTTTDVSWLWEDFSEEKQADIKAPVNVESTPAKELEGIDNELITKCPETIKLRTYKDTTEVDSVKIAWETKVYGYLKEQSFSVSKMYRSVNTTSTINRKETIRYYPSTLSLKLHTGLKTTGMIQQNYGAGVEYRHKNRFQVEYYYKAQNTINGLQKTHNVSVGIPIFSF